MFKLSQTSLRRLGGVNTELQKVVERAIKITEVDFGVIEGIRSKKRQQALFDTGATKTLYSKHLIGEAVDLAAYAGSELTWDIEYYDRVAEAMQQAAKEFGVSIRWGGAWHIYNIAECPLNGTDMRESYIDYKRSKGQKPFIDGVHFELYYN